VEQMISLMGRTNPFYRQGHALAGGVAFYMTARISARGRSAGWFTNRGMNCPYYGAAPDQSG